MKKALCILLCCLMVLWLPSCTPNKEETESSTSTVYTSSPTVNVREYYNKAVSKNNTVITTTTHVTIANATTTSRKVTTTTTHATVANATTTSRKVTTATTPATIANATTTSRKVTTTTTRATIVNAATTKSISRTVYITPSGKRYHYRSTCGGKNSYAVTLDEAIAKGRTPCKKCAM